MAQPVDFNKIHQKLAQSLNRILEHNASCQPAKISIEKLIQRRNLTSSEAEQVFQQIIVPFGQRALTYENKVRRDQYRT